MGSVEENPKLRGRQVECAVESFSQSSGSRCVTPPTSPCHSPAFLGVGSPVPVRELGVLESRGPARWVRTAVAAGIGMGQAGTDFLTFPDGGKRQKPTQGGSRELGTPRLAKKGMQEGWCVHVKESVCTGGSSAGLGE